MWFLHLYLACYFILTAGAGIALWRVGVLDHVSPMWIVITAVIVVSLGLLLAASSVRRVNTD